MPLKSTQIVQIFISLFVLLASLQTTVMGYALVDPNGCAITVTNVSNANAANGVHRPSLTTADTCIQYCVNTVRPQPCLAAEFDHSTGNNKGCWTHYNISDLVELFDAGTTVVHYRIYRTCNNASEQMNRTASTHEDMETLEGMSGSGSGTVPMDSWTDAAPVGGSTKTGNNSAPSSTTGMRGGGTTQGSHTQHVGTDISGGNGWTEGTVAMSTTTMRANNSGVTSPTTKRGNVITEASTIYDEEGEGSGRTEPTTYALPSSPVAVGSSTLRVSSTIRDDGEGSGGEDVTTGSGEPDVETEATTTKLPSTNMPSSSTVKTSTTTKSGVVETTTKGLGSKSFSAPGFWSIGAAALSSLMLTKWRADTLKPYSV